MKYGKRFLCAVLLLALAAPPRPAACEGAGMAPGRGKAPAALSAASWLFPWARDSQTESDLEEQIRELQQKLEDCENQLALMEEMRFRLTALEEQLGEHMVHSALDPVAAEVIDHYGGAYMNRLTLNVGADQGIENNMAVVAQGGLVGVTCDVRENRCGVLCIINSSCAVAALIQPSRDQGIVRGVADSTGDPLCHMYFLQDSFLPRPGDTAVTSGVGLPLPKGIPIGYILETLQCTDHRDTECLVLEPVVDFQHLEYVTVYRYRPSSAP